MSVRWKSKNSVPTTPMRRSHKSCKNAIPCPNCAKPMQGFASNKYVVCTNQRACGKVQVNPRV